MIDPVGRYGSIYGIGGPVFSGGMKVISGEAKAIGYEAYTRFWWLGTSLGKQWAELPVIGPVVIAGHSAGASGINACAEAYGKPVDLAIFVDAWLPNMKPHPNIRRSISIRAERFGRFAVSGPGVVQQITIPDTTHTTVDDSEQLRAIIRAELEALL